MEAADGVEILVCWLSQIWLWSAFFGCCKMVRNWDPFTQKPLSRGGFGSPGRMEEFIRYHFNGGWGWKHLVGRLFAFPFPLVYSYPLDPASFWSRHNGTKCNLWPVRHLISW